MNANNYYTNQIQYIKSEYLFALLVEMSKYHVKFDDNIKHAMTCLQNTITQLIQQYDFYKYPIEPSNEFIDLFMDFYKEKPKDCINMLSEEIKRRARTVRLQLGGE